MKIKETGNFEAFELEHDGGDFFAFVYGKNNIGFDIEQAKQIKVALEYIIENGELPE